MHAPPPPTDRGCLIAWNTPANAPNRQRLAGVRVLSGLSLRSGVVYRDTIRMVTGAWRGGRVAAWSWGRRIASTGPFGPNVRRLADGRITKLYRR